VQLKVVPPVVIANGTHKYVQIELRLATTGSSGSGAVTKRLVRSYRGLKSHAENYRVAMQRVLATLAAIVTPTREPGTDTTAAGDGGSATPGAAVLHGVSGRVIGGGRIACDHSDRTVSVFGYSRSFGRAEGCNKKTAGIISTHLQYKVNWSDDGY
jgi:hypothetical protein